MIKPSRGVLFGGAVFVLAAAVLFTFTFVAASRASDEPKPRPALSASVGSTLKRVEPIQFCEVTVARCDTRRAPEKLIVKPGKAIVISLPSYITERPWGLTIQRFDTRTRHEAVETRTYAEPTKATLVLKSTDQLLLAAVEISVPSMTSNQFGDLISQAVWGIDTLDESAVG